MRRISIIARWGLVIGGWSNADNMAGEIMRYCFSDCSRKVTEHMYVLRE